MIDAKLPGLDEALDPPSMSQRFGCAVHHAQLVRHKPGKRALVRYDSDNGPLLGKLRAGHRATTPFKLLVHFHDAGFADPAPDDITVPEPVIAIPDLGLWVQRVVPGLSGETAFCDPALPDRRRTLGERAAEAAFKIHRAGVPTRRDHGATDELHILESRLDRVASTHPEHAAALIPVLEGCRRLVGELTVLDRPVCGIHRDYYADQLIVSGSRIVVCDFDLYCAGDPALDVGNFVAHLTEMALRVQGEANGLVDAEQACVRRYLGLAGDEHGVAISAYATLTLARHISLSTELPDRAHLTGSLIELTTDRLALG